MIETERVYDEAGPQDSIRSLVERLWPRGLKTAAVPLNGWLKEVAPSTVPARTPHSLTAQTPVVMLLILVKSPPAKGRPWDLC